MAKKRWFDTEKAASPGEDFSIDELIVLERYDEAERQLQEILRKNHRDIRAHIKLAEVYEASQSYQKAAESYSFAAEEYARDGFHDKGLALLKKAIKLRPLDDHLQRMAEAFRQGKQLEESRGRVVDELRALSNSGQVQENLALEVQRLWPYLVKSSVVRRLDDRLLLLFFAPMRVFRREAGDHLIEPGARLEMLFLIGEGTVEAVAPKAGVETVLRTFGPGDVIGESALFERKPWPTTYRVSDDLLFFALDRAGLERCLTGNPDPRRFLSALRDQHNDRDVVAMVERLAEKR